jgi:hypothetical protein
MARRERPSWQILVDDFLWRYVDAPATIKAQQIRQNELIEDGVRLTPVYEIREGSPGGEVTYQAQRHAELVEECECVIRNCLDRIELINSLLITHFDADQQEFIKLFWLDVPPSVRLSVWGRNKLVLEAIPWFRDATYRNRPSRSYYDYRLRVYQTWDNLLFGGEPVHYPLISSSTSASGV